MSPMMKNLLIVLLILIACSDRLRAQDEVSACRPIMSSLEVHLGSASVRNTYLTPLLYSGWDLGITYERARRWKQSGWVSQQMLSGQFTTGEDKGQHSENWSGRLRYRYAAHYDIDLFFLTLMVGPYVGAEVGFDYNLKMSSGNNPATARAAINTGLSLMAATHYRLLGRASKAALQLQAPLLGYAMMPEYGASYYESFYLGGVHHLHHFTSLHNQQDLDVRLLTDVPLLPSRGGDLRVGVGYHIETMKVNQTHVRFSAIEAIVGWTLQSLPFNRRNTSILKHPAYEAY